MSRPEIVASARGWIGTPYRHQASARGAGCDCLGLLRGVWRECIGPEPEPVPPYTPDWDEPQRAEALWQAAARHFLPKRIDDEAEGDVLLFRIRRGCVAKHLGIAARTGAAPSFIHAYSRRGVLESSMSMPWRGRIVARFTFPWSV